MSDDHRDGVHFFVTCLVVLWPLTIAGFTLAFTGAAPGAVTMGIGCGFWALVFTVVLIIWVRTKP